MVRKLNLVIIIFISMLLIPLPLYAGGRVGGGHGGSGGHGSGGHSSFGSHGFSGFTRGGHSGRGGSWGHGYSGHSGSGGRGVNGHNDRNSNHGSFHHGHHAYGPSSSTFAIGFGFGTAFPFVAYPYYAYPYYGYPYYDYRYNYPYAGSYPPEYGDPYTSYPPADQPSGGLDVQVTPDNQSYGDLEIHVTPENAEIYVDGKFIGQAKDFQGPAILSVSEGTHMVEVRYNGFSSSTTVNVNSGSTSVVQQKFQ